MATQFTDLLRQALQLSPVERAKLIEAIYRSFESKKIEDVSKAWAAEAEDRLNAYEKGDLDGRPYDEVKNSIQQK